MEYLDFWFANGVYGQFSNWSRYFVKENGIHFDTTEHYLMYHKALLMNDLEMAECILKDPWPSNAKKYGRQIKNYDEELWSKHRYNIMVNGLILKVTQHPEIKKILLESGSKTIREVSDNDSIWGTGPGPKRSGQNLLGLAWMEVRNGLLKNIQN